MQRKTFVLILSLLIPLAFAACGKTEPTQTNANANASGPVNNSGPASATGPTTSSGPADQSAAAPAKVTSIGVVKATAAPAEIAAGGASEANVLVQITDGYHINANPPTFSYLKATELSAEPVEGITAARPVYPASVTKSFTFAEKPLAVYEGKVNIKLPLRASSSASKGQRTLPLKLHVQACDDLACYPPGTLDVALALTVK